MSDARGETAGLAGPVWAPAAVAAGLALALGAYRLGQESLWGDEGISAFAVSYGWRELVPSVLDNRPTHALYYGILKLWSGAGSSEFVLRSLSVVCVVAAAALVAVLAARLFGRVAGFSAGVLFAVNPFVIAYAQEARVYALVALLTVIASLLFVRAIEGPTTGRWLVYALSAVALVYAHAVAGSVLIAHAIAFLLRSPRPWRPALLGLGAAAIGLAPLALAVTRSGTGAFVWITMPQPGDLYPAVRDLAGGTDPLVAGFVVATALAIWAALRHRTDGPGRWALALSALLVLTPFVLTYAVSLLVPVFVPRYLLVAVPGMVLLAAAGIATLPRTWMAASATLLLVAACAPVLWTRYTTAQNEDWRGAGAIVSSRAAPGDAVVVEPGWGLPAFGYYYDGREVPQARIALRLGGLDGRRRVWVVTAPDYSGRRMQVVLGQFAKHHPERRRWRLHRMLVQLHARR